MSARSVHEAAVWAGARALFDDVYGGSSGLDEMLESICIDNARLAIAALVASAEVREGLADAVDASDATRYVGSLRGIPTVYCYIPTHDAVDVILAALGGTNERGDA